MDRDRGTTYRNVDFDSHVFLFAFSEKSFLRRRIVGYTSYQALYLRLESSVEGTS